MVNVPTIPALSDTPKYLKARSTDDKSQAFNNGNALALRAHAVNLR